MSRSVGFRGCGREFAGRPGQTPDRAGRTGAGIRCVKVLHNTNTPDISPPRRRHRPHPPRRAIPPPPRRTAPHRNPPEPMAKRQRAPSSYPTLPSVPRTGIQNPARRVAGAEATTPAPTADAASLPDAAFLWTQRRDVSKRLSPLVVATDLFTHSFTERTCPNSDKPSVRNRSPKIPALRRYLRTPFGLAFSPFPGARGRTGNRARHRRRPARHRAPLHGAAPLAQTGDSTGPASRIRPSRISGLRKPPPRG